MWGNENVRNGGWSFRSSRPLQGMDCVRKETIEEQRLDYEKQIQEYKERAECLERQVLGELGDVGKRDKKELADENHALRELVRALQSKV